jgi:hypothetical protein
MFTDQTLQHVILKMLQEVHFVGEVFRVFGNRIISADTSHGVAVLRRLNMIERPVVVSSHCAIPTSSQAAGALTVSQVPRPGTTSH